jgi:hypothetical protein
VIGIARVAPAQEMPLDAQKDEIGEIAENAEGDDTGKHLGDVEYALAVEDEIAGAAIAGDHLGDNDDDRRQAETDAHAGKHAGERRRQHDLPQRLKSRQAEGPADIG